MTGAATVVAAGTFAPDPDVVMTSGQLVLEPWMNPTTTLSGTVLLREVRPTVLATNVAAGQTASLLLQSPIGTFGILAVGFPGDRTIVPGFGGDVWLDPATLCVAAFGVQNGALGWTTLVPALWPLPVQFRWQGAVIDAGVATFTDPGAAVID
jgi:hypothetical protein